MRTSPVEQVNEGFQVELVEGLPLHSPHRRASEAGRIGFGLHAALPHHAAFQRLDGPGLVEMENCLSGRPGVRLAIGSRTANGRSWTHHAGSPCDEGYGVCVTRNSAATPSVESCTRMRAVRGAGRLGNVVVGTN